MAPPPVFNIAGISCFNDNQTPLTLIFMTWSKVSRSVGERRQRLLDARVVECKIEPAEGCQRPLNRRHDIALLGNMA